MPSKIFYFNKTIYRKNFALYCPIWIAYFVICLILLPISLYQRTHISTIDSMAGLQEYRMNILLDVIRSALHPSFYFLFACLAAISVFSYLYKTKSAYMYHAFPVSRKSLYFTNVFSGISFLWIPQTITFFISLIICFVHEIIHLEYLLHWFVLSLGMSLFAFSLATVIIMITGQLWGVPILFLGSNFLFVMFRNVIISFVQTLTYGMKYYQINFGDFLSPYYFLHQQFNLFSTEFQLENSVPTFSKIYLSIGGYAIFSLFLFALALLLYEKKHLETTGDFITVSILKPCFRWGISIFCGLVLVCLNPNSIANNWKSDSFVLSLVLLFLGSCCAFFFSEMLLQKNFRIFSKKIYLEFGMISILLTFFLCIISFDAFQLETKVPKLEEIEKISIDSIYAVDCVPEDFEKIRQIHEKLISMKTETNAYFKKQNNTSTALPVDICYYLKNGSTLTRCYYLPMEEYYTADKNYVLQDLISLYHKPEYYLKHHFTNHYETISFMEGFLEVYNENYFSETVFLNEKQCNIIFEAFQKDISQGNYRIFHYTQQKDFQKYCYENPIYLHFSFPQNATNFLSEMYLKDTDDDFSIIYLTKDCINTLKTLRESGILMEEQQLLTGEEIEMLYSKNSDVP